MILETLLALTKKGIGEDDLWHWESPLMGGPPEPMVKYPPINWAEVELTSEDSARLSKLAKSMAVSNVAGQISDDGILLCIGKEKRTEIINQMKTAWLSAAQCLLGEVVGPPNSISEVIEVETFRGTEPEELLPLLFERFGREEVLAFGVAQINSTKDWWWLGDWWDREDEYKRLAEAYSALSVSR